ncbi:MAG: DUF4147 domain-containing protein [Sandaracinaceae bacterium]|nr:DUF4147 domain-containing protein [Sandaracinaceae bacterium]
MARFSPARSILGDLAPEVRARRELALSLVEAALDAVDPERATRDALAALGDRGPFTVFAFGKAAVPMARAALERVEIRGGVLVAPPPATGGLALDGLACFVGGHPDPAPDAARTAEAFLAAADRLGADDAALALVSGGGSALLELPRPPFTLDALSRLARVLRERGADIAELNAVRRRVSLVKGGGLARRIAPARITNLVLSDVPGAPPELVASGPTASPPPGAPSAEAVLARYGIEVALPPLDEAPLPPITTRVIADQGIARAALVAAARARGTPLVDRDGYFDGSAAALGRRLAREAREARGAGWVGGGETTVEVRGRGRGGRNQEIVVGALAEGWPGGLLLALGTDGIDGASDAAGGLLDEAVVAAVRARGLDPERALADNDSYTLLDAVGATLVSGPTGTNVADLVLYLP